MALFRPSGRSTQQAVVGLNVEKSESCDSGRSRGAKAGRSRIAAERLQPKVANFAESQMAIVLSLASMGYRRLIRKLDAQATTLPNICRRPRHRSTGYGRNDRGTCLHLREHRIPYVCSGVVG